MDSFFGIGIAELFVIAVIALIVLGPERLPGAIREVVKFTRQIRNLTSELTSEFTKEMSGLEDLNPNKLLQELVEDPEEKKKAQAAKAAASKTPPAKPAATKPTTSKPAAPKPATGATATSKPASTVAKPAGTSTSAKPAVVKTAPATSNGISATAPETDAASEPVAAASADKEAQAEPIPQQPTTASATEAVEAAAPAVTPADTVEHTILPPQVSTPANDVPPAAPSAAVEGAPVQPEPPAKADKPKRASRAKPKRVPTDESVADANVTATSETIEPPPVRVGSPQGAVSVNGSSATPEDEA